MEVSGMHRRLAAILTAEAVEPETLVWPAPAGASDRLERLFRTLIEPAVTSHEGHVVKRTGDGFLAEFVSAVEAVKCAVEIQRALGEAQGATGDETSILLRVGVTLGDVVAEGGEITGTGVDVAARLAGLADPGGICISRTVLGQIKSRGDLAFEDLGTITVETLPQPMPVFRVLLDPAAARPTARVAAKTSRSGRWQALALGVAVLAFLVSAGLWFFARGPSLDPAAPESMAFQLPDKPSVAVLPFDNLSDDPAQQHIADGLSHDLIADLSKPAELFVIARNSSFAYKGRPVSARQVAEDLGVHYVVTGSVRLDGDALQVNAQLIDAMVGGPIWAKRFEGEATDIFFVQDDFARQIAKALAVDLAPRGARRIGHGKTDHLAAWEAFHKGRGLYLTFNAEDTAQAIAHLERAIELDSDYGLAYAALSLAHYRSAERAWAQQDTLSFMDSWALAQHYLDRALHYPVALAHIAAATDYVWRGDADAAFNEALHAMLLDRNDPEAHLALAWAMIISGRPAAGLESVATAQRLNPVYPAHYDLTRAMAHFAMADFEGAAEVLAAATERNPGAVELAPPLAASYAYLGRREEARAALLAWKSGASQSELQDFADIYHFPIHWADDQESIRDRLFDGLRIAALPLDEDVPKLLGNLGDDSFLVRMDATKKLGWFRDQAKDAVPHLIPALTDEHDGVRKETALTLGKIGPAAKAAIPALEAARQETGLGPFANDALKDIRGK